MKKKVLALVLSTAMVLGSLTACNGSSDSSSSSSSTTVTDVAMQYMTVEDAAGVVQTDGYTFFDVRKAADYSTSHIPGAVSCDMDAAKEGDFDAGVATMKAAVENVDDTIILICYSGKSYAQAATNALSEVGYDMSKVYTLEGGFTAWTETYPDNVTAD